MISLAVPLAAMLTTTVVADGSHYTRKANAVFSGIGPAIITPMNADGTVPCGQHWRIMVYIDNNITIY